MRRLRRRIAAEIVRNRSTSAGIACVIAFVTAYRLDNYAGGPSYAKIKLSTLASAVKEFPLSCSEFVLTPSRRS
jgi:hypothetical protein